MYKNALIHNNACYLLAKKAKNTIVVILTGKYRFNLKFVLFCRIMKDKLRQEQKLKEKLEKKRREGATSVSREATSLTLNQNTDVPTEGIFSYFMCNIYLSPRRYLVH